jgi:hypothetical protein
VLAPVANASTTLLANGPVSTASNHQPTPISVETNAPVGDQQAGPDPLVPFGTETQAHVRLGYVNRNHDEGDTANGAVDLAF